MASTSRTPGSHSSEELPVSSYKGEDGITWVLPNLERNRSGPILEMRNPTTINGNKSDGDFIHWYVFFSLPSESSECIQANKHLKNVFSLPSEPSTINVFKWRAKFKKERKEEEREKKKEEKKEEKKKKKEEKSPAEMKPMWRPPPSFAFNDMRMLMHKPLLRFEHPSLKHELAKHEPNKAWNLLKDACLSRNANVSGPNNNSTVPNNAIFKQRTSLGNTVLHLAANNGNHAMIKKVAQHAPHLFTVVNNNNDTALHVAARMGRGSTIEFLLNNFFLFVRDVTKGHNHQSILEMMLMVSLALFRNKQGNTFIHEAFMFGSHNGAMIFEAFEDPFITCDVSEFEVIFKRIVNHLTPFAINVEGKSLLYLTIEFNCKEITDKLMNFCIEGELKPQGKLPLLPTLINNNLDMLSTILSKKRDWVHLVDEKGWLPLHYAAILGYHQGVSFLVRKCPSCTMERDNNGFLPIHWACFKGHVKIVEELLLKWHLDPIEILDDNGQNLLHHACQSGSYEVVRYFLKHPNFEIMINQKDNNGNTPLHLATKMSCPKIVYALTWDNRVNLSLLNHDNLTALDIVEQRQGNNYPSLSQHLTWNALQSAGAPRSFTRLYSNVDDNGGTHTTEQYKDRIDTLILVSTLIITTSFAAGFTVPGDQDKGSPVLLNRHMFHLFILSLTISVFGAISTTIILMWARLGDLHLAIFALDHAMPLLGLSLTTLSLAFLAGMYLIVSKVSWLATTFLVISVVLILMVVFLFVPLFLPSLSTSPWFRHISYRPFLFFANIAEAKMDASNKQRSTSIISCFN